MFSMVNGGWPRVTRDGIDLDALEADVAAGRAVEAALEEVRSRLVGEVVAAQAAAGVDVVTDGQVRWSDPGQVALAAVASTADGLTSPGVFVEAWRATVAAAADRPAAQAIPGPYTLGRRVVEGSAPLRAEVTLGIAGELARELRALADAGCPIVIVEEPAAIVIGEDPAERRLFAEAQRRLLSLAPDVHAMLAIVGGSAAGAGTAAIFDPPYRSHLFDLIEGPDNWVLVRAAPPDRGIVCGVLRAGRGAEPDQAPILVWAAHYAASAGARGLARVGLSNATSLRRVSRRAARAAATSLARAATLAALPPADAVAAGLDPRTFSNRRRPAASVPVPRAVRRKRSREG